MRDTGVEPELLDHVVALLPAPRDADDTGAGDPTAATAAKGAEYFAAVTDAICGVIVDVARATRGDVPFV